MFGQKFPFVLLKVIEGVASFTHKQTYNHMDREQSSVLKMLSSITPGLVWSILLLIIMLQLELHLPHLF